MSANDTLISWLNDAYALEQHLINVLKNHSSDAAGHPHMQRRIEQHLEETHRHADIVKDCIERMGGSTSAAKSAMGRFSGIFSGISAGGAHDELVKNRLSDYSMEHLEIASYKAIIAAAEALGHQDIAEACRSILVDEEQMAEWLDQNVAGVVQEYLAEQVSV